MQKGVIVILPCLGEQYLSTLLKKLTSYEVDVRSDKGLSNAVYFGIRNAKAKIVVVMDSDGSHPPEAIPKMLELLDSNVWFVVGSRYCPGGFSEDSFLRKFFSLFYCKIFSLFHLNFNIKDPMSGFWVGFRSHFVFEPSDSYKFGIQLINKYGAHVVEYPIFFKKRQQGKSHIKPKQAIKDLLVCLKG